MVKRAKKVTDDFSMAQKRIQMENGGEKDPQLERK